MYRLSRLLCVAATLTLAVAHVNEAQARRCHRWRCSSCCSSSCDRHFGDNYTCLLTEVYEIAPNDYIYYANFYEGSCYVEPQAVYAEASDFGLDPNQVCENYECILSSRKCKSYGSDEISHFTEKTFMGFPTPLEPGFPVHWQPGVTQAAEGFERLEFGSEGRTYKARVFDLRLPKLGDKIVHVAFEIAHFPDGINPVTIPLGPEKVKKCIGKHAYSVKYRGRTMLFLADREG